MTVYWILFLLPVAATFMASQRVAAAKVEGWALIWIVYVLAIGLRHEVGCDWTPYLTMFSYMNNLTMQESWEIIDPGYATISWVVANVFDGEIYVVNLISGAFFMTGLIIFARRQPSPSMALAVAVPYLVVVVAMGYTRQSIALGFLFAALAGVGKKPLWQYLLLVSIGALFHKSALLLLPLGVIATTRNRIAVFLATSALGVILGYVLLLDQYEALWTHYVEAEMASEGGLIRVLMNVVPAVLMFALWPRFKKAYPEDARIWFWIGVMSVACLPFVDVASTAVDRVALYFTPLQIVVMSRLPELSRNAFARPIWRLATLTLYGMVLWVWLNLGIHSRLCWIPYQTLWF